MSEEMIVEDDVTLSPRVPPSHDDDDEDDDDRVARLSDAVPPNVALAERFAAIVRRSLDAAGLADYRLFSAPGEDLLDWDDLLPRLDAEAGWSPLDPLVAGGLNVTVLPEEANATPQPHGTVWLRRHRVVVARAQWPKGDSSWEQTYWLFAAPSVEDVGRLRHEIAVARREQTKATWDVIRHHPNAVRRVHRVARPAWEDLVLAPDVRRRVEAEMIGFFTDPVAKLYEAMRVPYRRGVLLHGPPGNGKTSLIRAVTAALPDVPAMVLRPGMRFDDDHLDGAFNRWRRAAPAVLVIEDLNWLLQRVNVSTLLNLLDGIEPAGGGLLLIATTNHPDKLDPAINNRPGRFDVVLEIPNPDEALRAGFFRQALPELDPVAVANLARQTDGLSFSHLQEVVRLSGLNAIHAGRPARTEEDVTRAAEITRAAHDAASRGFPMPLSAPFGLAPRRGK